MTKRYAPKKHHRRSIRLKGYDYRSPGAYFVTICTRGRECVLDDPVVTGIITDVWYALLGWFPTIALDEFVVMPNHIHLIVWLHGSGDAGGVARGARGARASLAPTETMGDVGATLAVAHPAPWVIPPWVIPDPETVNLDPALGDVIGAFKSLVFTVYLDWVKSHDPTRRAKFWQRNYYEHIIRNERELHAVRRYIRDNPIQWALDRDNPNNLRRLPLPTTVEDYLGDIQTLLEGRDEG